MRSQTLLLCGRVLSGRDSARKRLVDLLRQGQDLPVDPHDRTTYYIGPVDTVAADDVGQAGPTIATRMDKFVEAMLAQSRLLAMIGKTSSSARGNGPGARTSIEAAA